MINIYTIFIKSCYTYYLCITIIRITGLDTELKLFGFDFDCRFSIISVLFLIFDFEDITVWVLYLRIPVLIVPISFLNIDFHQ